MILLLLYVVKSIGSDFDFHKTLMGKYVVNRTTPSSGFSSLIQFDLCINKTDNEDKLKIYLERKTQPLYRQEFILEVSKEGLNFLENDNLIAEIDIKQNEFSQYVSTGIWNNSETYSYVQVNDRIMNLHIFNQDDKLWKFYTFYKVEDYEDHIPLWVEYGFKYIMTFVTMFLMYMVVMFVQRRYKKKFQDEVASILDGKEKND